MDRQQSSTRSRLSQNGDMLEHWGLWATIAGIIVSTAWVVLRYHHVFEIHPRPRFKDAVDLLACIGILIVVTTWLGFWDSRPRQYSGTLAYGEGVARLGGGILKAVFLVLVPSLFLTRFMGKRGDLRQRVAIYCGFFALALVVWIFARLVTNVAT